MRKLYLLVSIVLVQLLLGLNVHAQSVMILPFSSQWKYLDNGSDQGTAWRATSFNDASWSADTGTFGYNDPWITKCINACGTVSCAPACTNKYITTYFRKTITISDVSMFDSVQFSVMRDDGFIIYVNGVAVASDNMPTPISSVTYATKAPVAIGSTDEYTPITKNVPISAFVSGTNVIAVELHQQDGTSSDVTFNMQMKAYAKSILFPYGSIWKYYVGSDLGTTWRDAAYAEPSWSTSTGGHIGFGETWTTTCIPAGPTGCTAGCLPGGTCTKYPTTYFRRTLSIPDPTFYDSIRFSVFRDDGIVMYVNGVEQWRDNMPTGTINYNSTAPNNVNGTTGTYAESLAVVRSLPISAFAIGNNVIAIEVHQNTTTSSDLDFNVQVQGVPHVVPTLVRGPYLQMGSDTAFTVRWRTDVACKSKLEIGTSTSNYSIVLNDAAMVTEHEMRVRNLTPNTKYYYRFGSDLDVLQGDTTNFCVTAPAAGTSRRVTLAAYGDCGQNSNSYQTGSLSAYRAYLSSIGLQAADMMLLVGDNAYNSGTDAEFQTGFFAAYQSTILKNHMLFPAPGNHDYANDATRQDDHNIPYLSIFTMPKNGECGGVPSGKEEYYSYNWGDVHVLSLDSYGEESNLRLYDTTGAQVQWIKADLAANTKKWVIAYWHHPPYTMGSHTSDGETELVNIRQNFIRILERYGVDMIICGHSHDYERSYLLKGHFGNEASFDVNTHAVSNSSAKYDGSTNSCPYTTVSGKVNHGTVYVVSGSSGASGGTQGGYPHNAFPFSLNDGGMFFVDINNNRLDAKFIRKDGTIWDKFTIMKDVKVQDTVNILYGASTNLTASWEGSYAWTPTVTTRTVTVTPAQDSLVEVKDNLSATCLTDKHYVNLLCTIPNITSVPANIIREGCDNIVTYAIADTGRPAPAITYAFTGATVASGNGTGSGSTFSIGVTTVTITASNECGNSTRSFTVTIKPLPTAYNMTGGGGYCPGGTGVAIGLDNTQPGISYQLYRGPNTIGLPIIGNGSPISFGTHSVTGTYSVLATDNTTTCNNWAANTKQVFVHTLPTAQAITGGGNYCAGTTIGSTIGLAGSQSDVSYQLYNGSSAVNSSVAGTGSAISFGNFTTTSTFSVVATDNITTCVNNMSGSVTIGIDPLPVAYTVTGGGHYCMNGAGKTIGLDNSENGVNYRLYDGATAVGNLVAGTGNAISFGSYTAATTYTVLATNAATSCVKDMTGDAQVVIDPLPTAYAISAGGDFCPGGTGIGLNLANSDAGISYQLFYGTSATGSAVAGIGTVLPLGTHTGPGTYTVLATNTATNCQNGMTGTATIGNYALPTAYSVTGGGPYCAGAAGVIVGLANSDVNKSYQLYDGTTAIGSPAGGTGTAISFGTYTAASTYSVVATDIITTCVNDMTGSVSISIDPLPVIYNVTGGGNYCSGGAGKVVGLDNSENGVNYRLYDGTNPVGSIIAGDGGAISFGSYTTATIYTVEATNATTTCTEHMNGGVAVTIDPLPTVYTMNTGGNYCSGGTGVALNISGSQTGINYQLYYGTAPLGAPVAGTGSLLVLGTRTGAGVYTVNATNTATGCTNAMAGSAAIGIYGLPTIYSITGGGSFCAGGTGVAVGLGGSTAGISYQLYKGGAPVGTPVIGAGLPVTFGMQTGAGSYNVIATDATTTCTNNMSGVSTVVVTAISAPTAAIAVFPNDTVCDGTSVLFNATPVNGGPTPNYEWKVNGTTMLTGAPTYNYTPANGDVVSVILYSSLPCITSSSVTTDAAMTVRPNLAPSTTLVVTSDSVCNGTPVSFSVTSVNGGTDPVYTWLKNSTTVATGTTTYSFTPLDGDAVVVSMASNAPCRTSDVVYSNLVSMQVDESYIPAVTLSAIPGENIAKGQPVTFTADVAAGGPIPTYKWYINSTLQAGATNASFTTAALNDKDTIMCMVHGSGLCGLDGFNALVMNVTSLDVATIGTMDALTVIPNPTNGMLTTEGMTGSGSNEVVTITVSNVLGQEVSRITTSAVAGRISERISLDSHLADGTYLLSVGSSAGKRVFHIVLKR